MGALRHAAQPPDCDLVRAPRSTETVRVGPRLYAEATTVRRVEARRMTQTVQEACSMGREKWQYQGARVALGYGSEVEGKRCYWFRRDNVGQGGTTMIVPVDTYWAAR